MRSNFTDTSLLCTIGNKRNVIMTEGSMMIHRAGKTVHAIDTQHRLPCEKGSIISPLTRSWLRCTLLHVRLQSLPDCAESRSDIRRSQTMLALTHCHHRLDFSSSSCGRRRVPMPEHLVHRRGPFIDTRGGQLSHLCSRWCLASPHRRLSCEQTRMFTDKLPVDVWSGLVMTR